MPHDYGHELRFGVFITPDAAQANAVVELARLADAAGLELVTFQDHPYQPRFLDSWTLLSVVAAETTTVSLSLNVANLPLRDPLMLAKSVASLDILSGGRVELGLGAGAFWDGVAAFGGPRRTPGQSVDALREAIEIIRAAWTSGGAGIRYDGGTTRSRARGWARRPRIPSSSGSARTSGGCSRSRGPRPTGGCRAWGTSISPICRG